ncbi:MAG: phage tail protein I [Lentisphaerae bacterium]|nr:phage tail protein I [Lentisphaerota bacterium]MCP4102315.1 phage tail protein I [Lentisphaerota bacterium]
MSLLPNNATKSERGLEAATARLEQVPVPTGDLWNPTKCPTALLPYLAWALSVDVWRDDWTEAEQRAIIAKQYEIHAHKGTIGALKKALEDLGYQLKVLEWFEQSPTGEPCTFTVEAEVGTSGLNAVAQALVEQTITATKNVRSHLSSLKLVGRSDGVGYLGVSTTAGDTVTLYPPVTKTIEQQSSWYAAIRHSYQRDIVTILQRSA